jgi:hypothetical protein
MISVLSEKHGELADEYNVDSVPAIFIKKGNIGAESQV